MPKVVFSQKAEKRLARLPRQDQAKIARAAAQMKISPFESVNVKRYQVAEGKFYRLRLGNLRLIFEFDSKADTVFIVALDYRGNIY